MKKSVRVFGIFALVPLLMAGLCAGYVWRGARQHENDKALLAAIKARNAPAVIAALKRGANPNARATGDDTRSLKERLIDLIHPTALLRDTSPTMLHVAVMDGCEAEYYNFKIRGCGSPAPEFFPDRPVLIQALLVAGADPNARLVRSAEPVAYHDSLLIMAEHQHHREIAHLLLQYYADIHKRDRIGETPLLNATRYDDAAEVAFLLQHGASIEEEDHNGESVVERAALYDSALVMKYLIKHGANVNHRDKEGHTALYDARLCECSDVEKLLRKAGAVE